VFQPALMIASNSVRTHWSSPVTIVQKASLMSGRTVPVDAVRPLRYMAHHHPSTLALTRPYQSLDG
jgi:hypothetical protein